MRLDGAFVGANPLVLLVVGLVDRTLIATYRRTRRFTGEDYDRVFGIIEGLHRTPIEALM